MVNHLHNLRFMDSRRRINISISRDITNIKARCKRGSLYSQISPYSSSSVTQVSITSRINSSRISTTRLHKGIPHSNLLSSINSTQTSGSIIRLQTKVMPRTHQAHQLPAEHPNLDGSLVTSPKVQWRVNSTHKVRRRMWQLQNRWVALALLPLSSSIKPAPRAQRYHRSTAGRA